MAGGIGFVLFTKSLGGAERRYLRVANFLAEQGHEVTLVCNDETLKLVNRHGIQIERLGLLKVRTSTGVGGKFRLIWEATRLLNLMNLVRAVQKFGFDHIHLVSNAGVLVTMFAMFSFLLPPTSACVFGRGSDDTGKSSWRERTFLMIAIFMLSKIDCLTPSFHSFAKGQSLPYLHRKIRLAPCSFSDYSMANPRAERDIDVVFLARFAPGKGLEYLPSIARAVIAEGKKMHVVGAGPLVPPVDEIPVYETVKPYEVLGRTKIFLSVQEKENYPSQALLEAMASGCAVVATDVGDTRLLLDETVAELVEPTASSIVQATLKLLKNPQRASEMGQNARARVVENHTIERFGRYFINEIVGGSEVATNKRG